MANHASALKAHRQNVRRRSRNRSNRGALRTALKNYSRQIQAAGQEKQAPSAADIYSLIDKGVRKGALSKNAAARQKSRMTKRLNKALGAQPAK